MGDIDKDIKDEAKKRLERCIPIAKEMILLISISDVVLGEADAVVNAKVYDDIAEKMLKKMLNANIPYSDRQFIFQLAMQAIEMTQEKVIKSIERSYEIARDKMWGKSYFDVNLKDIDDQLKK